MVFEAQCPECARLEFLGCRVRAPAARSGGATGVSHDSPRAQMCTFQGPGASNTTKIPGEDPKRGMKRRNVAGGKKHEILAPTPSGPIGFGPWLA